MPTWIYNLPEDDGATVSAVASVLVVSILSEKTIENKPLKHQN